jgi:hypothetical protein
MEWLQRGKAGPGWGGGIDGTMQGLSDQLDRFLSDYSKGAPAPPLTAMQQLNTLGSSAAALGPQGVSTFNEYSRRGRGLDDVLSRFAEKGL